MLPRRSRVLKKHFPSLRKGVVFHTPAFTARFLSGQERRISVVVSKKIAPKAVDRNNLKRKVNAIFRRTENDFPYGYSVLWAKKPTSTMKTSALEEEMALIVELIKNKRLSK